MEENQLARIAALIAGTILLVTSVTNINWGAMRHAWPKVEGRVVASFVKNHHVSYETVVEYEYSVKGQTYRSSRFGAVNSAHYEADKRNAEYIISLYPIGKRVDVYFNPNNPHKATLDLRYSKGTPLDDFFGLIVYMVTLLLLVFAFTGMKSRRWGPAKPPNRHLAPKVDD